MSPKKTQTKIKNKEAATQVYPSLFLGPYSAATNSTFLAANPITYVLSIGSAPSQYVPNVVYSRLALTDSTSSSITKVVDAANSIIDDALASHNGTGRILVHCSAAVSRSPTAVVAYLMKRHDLTLMQALGRVVLARPTVSPNAGFLDQLKQLEKDLFGEVTLRFDELPKRMTEREALFKLNMEQFPA